MCFLPAKQRYWCIWRHSVGCHILSEGYLFFCETQIFGTLFQACTVIIIIFLKCGRGVVQGVFFTNCVVLLFCRNTTDFSYFRDASSILVQFGKSTLSILFQYFSFCCFLLGKPAALLFFCYLATNRMNIVNCGRGCKCVIADKYAISVA